LRSPSKIIQEIKDLKEKLHINDFMFWADTFTIHRDHTIELCNMIIKENLNIHWTTTTRVDLVDEELLQLMKKSGCWLIVHGIESGREEHLKKMQKGITLHEIKQNISLEKKLGLTVIGHFIIGYPDEDEKDIEETIKLALELPIDYAQFYFATPFPGSQLYTYCKERNLLRTNNWADYEQEKTVIINNKLSPDKLYALRKSAYRRFYLRPRIIIKNLIHLLKPEGIYYFTQHGTNFMRWLVSGYQ